MLPITDTRIEWNFKTPLVRFEPGCKLQDFSARRATRYWFPFLDPLHSFLAGRLTHPDAKASPGVIKGG
jgi:hypothetical protein